MSSRLQELTDLRSGQRFRRQPAQGPTEPDKERQPLLAAHAELDNSEMIQGVLGQSTLSQTVVNSVNVLVGVGLLSLPLGFKHAGWLVGIVFLVFCAIITRYTAITLAKCLELDDSLITFADIAYIAFGDKFRIVTGVLFSLELIAASVALIVLFADSMNALFPAWGILQWKIFCGIFMIPLNFIPLRHLSITSVLGILSCFGSMNRVKLAVRVC